MVTSLVLPLQGGKQMDDIKKQLKDMEIQYQSSNDHKEYTVTIGQVKNMNDSYLTGTSSSGGYLGVDLVTGEITKEYLDDGIPQPYTAGTMTEDSMAKIKETLNSEKGMDMGKEEGNMEQMEVMKQLMELLEQQNMQPQSQDLSQIFQYMAGMQMQLGVMAEELHNVKEQLAQEADSQRVPMKEKLVKQAEQLETKVSGLLEKLTEIKNYLMDHAAQALQAFKEKGQQGLNKALHTGVTGARKMVSAYRNQLSEVLMNYEKTANQIDSIGDELKQIGNSAANVGRLLSGKGTKEVSEDKEGVALTRIINKPIKKHVAFLKSSVEKTGRMCERLDQMSQKLEPKQAEQNQEKPGAEQDSQSRTQEKKSQIQENAKSDRVSVKARLEQMKEKSAAGKPPEKAPTKAKEQAVGI